MLTHRFRYVLTAYGPRNRCMKLTTADTYMEAVGHMGQMILKGEIAGLRRLGFTEWEVVSETITEPLTLPILYRRPDAV
jgi:hypothetical protein